MSTQLDHTRWKEKYRPKTLDEYIGGEVIKNKVKKWLDDGDIPDLLFYGGSGGGKTSLAKIIAKHLDADVLYINASDENSVDVIRDKIKGFAATSGFSRWKVVILDEADFTTQNFQAALRNVLEQYSLTTRFILTCNYVEKIIGPIRSRCDKFNITPPDKKQVFIRAKEILELEKVEFDPKDLAATINQYYPDVREIISSLQSDSSTGKLIITDDTRIIGGYCDKILEELKQSSSKPKECFKNIRQIIADAKVHQFDDLFRHLFDNLETFVPDGKRSNVIITIAEYQHKSSMVVDREIQVAAMFINILNDLQ